MELTKYILKRLFWLLVTLFIIMTATFFLMQVMPGTPFNNPKLTPQQLQTLSASYGLNKPVWEQYLLYLGHMFTGDFGTSFSSTNQPVSSMILQRLPVSGGLGLDALVIGILLGTIMGMSSARHKNSWIDAVLGFISTLSISVPSFVIGSVLLLFFGYTWGILPVTGWDGPFSLTAVMPALALAFTVIGGVTRFVRAEMVESLESDYILLARAKGLSEKEVVNKHAFRNSIIPMLTLIAPMAANLLTGSILIENIFGIPGIGSQFVTSISAKDYPVIMATTIVYALMLMVFILVTDVITALVDPRIRLQ